MRRLALALATAALLVAPAAAQADGRDHEGHKAPDLAIIGDTPYGATMLNLFPGRIGQINADPTVGTVVHLGDIKNGSSRCDTSYFDLIRTDFDLFADPLIYTPGDNEWTDCHRTNNGGYQPAGPAVAGTPVITAGPSRLSELRRIFFPVAGRTLGQSQREVEPQEGEFVENVRWEQSGTIFGVVNVPGSNNDLLPWFGSAESDALKAIQAQEYATRNAASIAWLREVFGEARDERARGVAIGIQADMWDLAITGDPLGYSGFTAFVKELAKQTVRFGKPVLLMNGDSHVYGSDKPLADPAATSSTIYGISYAVPNLTRVTIDGSGAANDYLRLHIDPKAAGVFSFSRVNYLP